MGIVFLVSLWYGWEQCAPYRQLRRGDSEPCRPYPTGGWRWWRRRIAYVLIGLLALVPLGSLLGVWSTMNQRIDAYPSNYFAYDLYSLPEHRELPYIDLAGLDYRGTLNDRVSYWERANTFTTIYASNVTQSTEVYSLPLQYLTTDYYHMRSAYFADLLQEKLLLGATGIESMLLPEVDEALRGRDEDNNPFLLVRRGNRMIYFECSEGLVDLYAQAEAVVDLLDQALERQRMNSVQQGDFLLPGRAGQAAKRNVRVQSPEREGSADWGEIIKGWVLQGADQAATGITSTLSMLEGAVMKPMGALLGNDQLYESGPFHTLNDYMQEAKEANEEHFTPEYKKAGRIGEVLGDIGPSVVAAVPQAVLAFMTAGTSAAAQGTTAGVQAAGQAAQGAGVARTFLNTLRNTAQNPQFLYSVLSTAGNEYEQAKAEGADDGRAYAYAALTGLLNSVVEASGGIDTLTPDNKRVLQQWVDTMLDEGRE